MELKDLIQSIDIVDYIGQYIELEFRNGQWWGLSPFNEENTPSFAIRKELNVFYDFSSGASGNVYSFTVKYFHCSPKEAIEKLKKYAGITDNIFDTSSKLSATSVCKKFSKPKFNNKQSTAKVLSENYMDRYELRYDKLQTWVDEGISPESLSKFNVRYDAFSDRLVYPIKNLNGEIVNVGGRTLVPNWKDLGLRKYTYFQKWGTIDLIYGLFDNLKDIKAKGEVIIFEGVKSVLLADTWGIYNTGCLLTSHLSFNQMKILARLGCRVVFALDKDVRVLQDKNIRKLKQYVNVEYICDLKNLLNDKDAPVDKGYEVFQKLYDECRLKVR